VAASKFWAEDIVEEILKRKTDQIVLNSGKSISGRVHIGIFREFLICDTLKRLLENKGKQVKFYFIVDDYDPAKHFPPYIPEEYEKFIGVPFSDIPSPENKNISYAEFFAKELIDTFPIFGFNPEIVWTSKLYETKEMKDIIRIVLNKIDIVREILIKYVGATLSEAEAEQYSKELKERYPISVICSKCGKMQTNIKGKITPNRVLSYNKQRDTITYYCNHCQEKHEEPVQEARLKLNWRVDWPAKWKLLKVTCEPAGKDHSVKGGAYDTGLEICKRVFDYEGPVKVPYEWLRLGESDMKTHKGIIFTPTEYLKIGPPEVLRYIILRTTPSKHISFRPELIPQYIDEYDRLERIYFNQENNVSEQEEYEAKILYPLTQINKVPEKPKPRLPFRFAVIFSQLKDIMDEKTIIAKAEEVLKKTFNLKTISEEQREEIKNTIKRAENWVTTYSTDRYKIKITKTVDEKIKTSLSEEQKEVIQKIITILDENELNEEELQNKIFDAINSVKTIKVKKGFEAIYQVILGRKFGPRLGSFLISLDKEWLLNRLKEALQ